jgi:hypothetical protein
MASVARTISVTKKYGLFSSRAFANSTSPHGYQSTGLYRHVGADTGSFPLSND